MSTQLDLGLTGEVTTTAWTPDPAMTYEAWERQIGIVGRLGQTTLFLLGDGLRAGQAFFGERYAQALDATGYSEKTISNLMWVAERVPPENRREELSHGHHEVVAHLEPAVQRKWLQRAIDEHLTRDELRALVKGKESTEPTERAAVSDKRKAEILASVEQGLAKWWQEVEPKQLGKQAYRATEFERLAQLILRRVVKVLGG